MKVAVFVLSREGRAPCHEASHPWHPYNLGNFLKVQISRDLPQTCRVSRAGEGLVYLLWFLKFLWCSEAQADLGTTRPHGLPEKPLPEAHTGLESCRAWEMEPGIRLGTPGPPVMALQRWGDDRRQPGTPLGSGGAGTLSAEGVIPESPLLPACVISAIPLAGEPGTGVAG